MGLLGKPDLSNLTPTATQSWSTIKNDLRYGEGAGPSRNTRKNL